MRGELAQNNRAGSAQAPHRFRIGRGDIVQHQMGMAGGRHAGHVDDVLYPDGNADERKIHALPHRTICLFRLPPHGHRVDVHHGVYQRIQRRDPSQRRFGDVDRREPSCPVAGGHLRRGQCCEIGQPSSPGSCSLAEGIHARDLLRKAGMGSLGAGDRRGDVSRKPARRQAEAEIGRPGRLFGGEAGGGLSCFGTSLPAISLRKPRRSGRRDGKRPHVRNRCAVPAAPSRIWASRAGSAGGTDSLTEGAMRSAPRR
jgi:hypothetical protein